MPAHNIAGKYCRIYWCSERRIVTNSTPAGPDPGLRPAGVAVCIRVVGEVVTGAILLYNQTENISDHRVFTFIFFEDSLKNMKSPTFVTLLKVQKHQNHITKIILSENCRNNVMPDTFSYR